MSRPSRRVRWRFSRRCALGWHAWGWPSEVVIGGRRHPVRFCKRCPANKWLGPSRPVHRAQTG